ncbi:hypothetical protein VNO77_22978 [Canavalia gladiata]|uniref:Uncharacterized protein n=1 Tax=Canavalia gladiata TaxID=3824 RepID=A0AAN9L662_CANGL
MSLGKRWKRRSKGNRFMRRGKREGFPIFGRLWRRLRHSLSLIMPILLSLEFIMSHISSHMQSPKNPDLPPINLLYFGQSFCYPGSAYPPTFESSPFGSSASGGAH